MTDEPQKDEHPDFSSPFGFYAVPVDPNNLPPFLRNMFEASLHCAERGHHCKCWEDGDHGAGCCRCGAVKGVSVPPPRLTACPKLEKREEHYAHKKRWHDGEVTECGGYYPPPNPVTPPEEQAPSYVWPLIQTILTGQPVNFKGLTIPEDLRHVLEGEVKARRMNVTGLEKRAE
jgi:hypothetical protein